MLTTRPVPVAHLALLALLFTTGPARAAVQVTVEGLDGPRRDNVRALLTLARSDADIPDRAVHRLHARAPEEIRLALQPFGYYRPAIDATLERDGDGWRARYVVDAAFDSAAILVTAGEDRAEIVLHLDSGPRYRFGPVTLVQEILHEDRVAG